MAGPGEVWKPVVGFEGLYEVSNKGRVRSVDHVERQGNSFRQRDGRIRKLHLDKTRWRVQLSKNGKRRVHTVRSLMRAAFA